MHRLAAGFEPGVWKWKEDERAKLRAELDAAYFHLYGLSRDDVSYILGTFQGIKKEDDSHGGGRRDAQARHAGLRRSRPVKILADFYCTRR
jgi:hypothetical protein